jgi:hypothetical protein
MNIYDANENISCNWIVAVSFSSSYSLELQLQYVRGELRENNNFQIKSKIKITWNYWEKKKNWDTVAMTFISNMDYYIF